MTTKKLVRYIFLIAVGFVLVLVILAEVFKNDMVKLALEKGAKTFEVPITVGEVDFSLLYRFPLATIEFNDLVAYGNQGVDAVKIHSDTIASISKLYASVDIMELIKGNIMVRKIDIENVKANYLVDSAGHSNFDFLLNAQASDSLSTVEDTTKAQGIFTLDKLTLKNIELKYEDDFFNASAQLNIPKLIMNGQVQPNGFKAATKGELIVQQLRYDNYNLELLVNSSLNFDVTAQNDTLQIAGVTLKAGSAVFNLEGNAITTDSTQVDIRFSGSEIDMAKNTSMLPQNMLEEYKISEVSGLLDVKGSAQGYFSKNTIPFIEMNFNLADGSVKYDTYPEVKNMVLEADLTNGYDRTMASTVLKIKMFQAQTALSSLKFSGTIQNPNQPQYDVSASIAADLSELLPFVPDSTLRKMSGKVKADITTSGILPDSISADFVDYFLNKTKLNLSLNQVNITMDSLPAINGLDTHLVLGSGSIKLNNISMEIPEYHVALTQGYLQGSYKGQLSQYENLSLQIDSLLLATSYSYISASGYMNGLKKGSYHLNTALNINLAEVKQWLPDSMANSMSGSLAANVASKGAFDFDSIADQAMPLLFNNSTFYIAMNDIFLNMPDTLMNVKMLSGNMRYKNDSIWVNQLSGNYLGLDFEADSTTISNVYTAALQNKPKEMVVQGNFAVGDMDYAWIEGFLIDTVLVENPEAKLVAEPYKMNFTYKIKGKAKAKSFKYEDVLIENLDTKFLAKVNDGYYVADGLTCNAFDGNVSASVKYQMFPNFRDVLQFKTDMQNVNVPRMLKELETYIDQEDFTDKNVLGKLTAQMDGRVVLENYEVLYDSLMLRGDLKLENGALIKVKPIMEIEKIPLTGLKNLDKLYFNTIESNLFLYNNEVYIPQTQIVTSSFDASFLGMYSFGEDYAYHVRVFLGEVLGGKTKSNVKKQAKEGGFVDNEKQVVKGRTPLYLVSKSEKGKETAWFDVESNRDRMKTRIRVQNGVLKFMFFPQLEKYTTGVD